MSIPEQISGISLGSAYIRPGTVGAITSVTYIAGSWITVDTTGSLFTIDQTRTSTGQLAFVSQSKQFYIATKVPADFLTTFDDTVTWTPFTFSGSFSGLFSGSFSGSFQGDGSQLTGIASTLAISGSTGNDTINLQTNALTLTGSAQGIAVAVTDNKATFSISNTASITGSFTGSFAGNGSGLTGVAASPAGNDKTVQFRSGSTTAGAADFVYDHTTGNVGIGTVSPVAKLQVAGDMVVDGKITAQEFHSEFVSSSIIYQSGSTQFGNSTDDTHIFTGSVGILGQVTATGYSGSFSGSFFGDGSGLTGIASTLAISGSTGNDTINLKTQALVITGSVNNITVAVTDNTATISIPTGVQLQGGFTGSFSGSISAVIQNAVTASYVLNAVSASYSLNAISASYAATASSANGFIVRNALTASGLNYPATDGLFEGQVIQTNATGTLSFGDLTTIYETVYNGEINSLTKGTPVYISGSQGANPIVYRADAADPAKMPVTYIVSEEIATASTGRGILLGLISGIDLTGYTAGQEVYVAAGGGWTATRPTGSVTVQFLGLVTKPNSGGKGLVLNPGPATLPNLTKDYVWLGDTNAYPVAVASSSLIVNRAISASFATSANSALTATSASFALTASAVGQLNQSVVINGNLTVFGTSSFTYTTSSQLAVDAAFISVNVFEPVERFGGIKVYDSGALSHVATASLAWDSQRNHWVYQNESGSTYSGGGLMSGPRNSGSLGSEEYPTLNTILRGQGGDHLYDSNIKDNDIAVQVGIPLQVTGSLIVTQNVVAQSFTGSFTGSLAGSVTGNFYGAASGSFIGNGSGLTGVAANPAGSDKSVQFKSGSVTSGAVDFVYDHTTQRVGIGSVTPGYKLEVDGTQRVSGNFYLYNTVTNVASNYADQRGLGFNATTGTVEIAANTVALELGRFSTTGAVLSIRHSGSSVSSLGTDGGAYFTGNVGIGTATPSQKLDISAGHIRMDDGYKLRWGDGTAAIEGNGASDVLISYTDNTERTRITSDGWLLVGKSTTGVGVDGVQLRAGSYSGFSAAGATALFVNRNTNDGTLVELGRNGVAAATLGITSSALTIGTNSSERIRILSDGNVGIGTATPASKLHVSGSILLENNFALQSKDASGNTRRIAQYTSGNTVILGSDTSHVLQLASNGATILQDNGTDLDIDPSTAGGDIILLTNQTGGSVGIGSASPAYKLDVVGSSRVTGDLIVTGKVTAEEFHTEFISASILFSSGSTIFGNTSDDTHQFTGSVGITAQLYAGLDSEVRPQVVGYNTATGELTYFNSSSILASAIPGGSDNQVQYNDNGVMAGASGFVWTGTSVGIGTASPGYKLDVAGAFRVDGTNGDFIVDSTGNDIYLTRNGANYFIANQASSAISFLMGAGLSQSLFLKHDGNVGVGTSTAQFALDIYNGQVGSSTSNLVLTSTNYNTYIRANAAYSTVINDTTSANVQMVVGGGKVGIGTTNPSANLTIYSTTNETGLALHSSGSRNYRMFVNPTWATGSLQIYDATADVSVIHISPTSNVGIGVGATSPTKPLHVVGGVRFSSYGAGSITGTATKTLGVDSSGNVIELDVSSNGTGVANQVAFWKDTDTVSGSQAVTWNGSTFYINGTLEATEKSFVIDHPTLPGKKLVYGVLEGPEHAVYCRGKISGEVIQLPEEWTGLVDSESITVQLTPIGKHQNLYVVDIKDNKVFIKNGDLLTSKINAYYYIQATRKDIKPLTTVREA